MDSFQYWSAIYLESIRSGLEEFESEELRGIQQIFQSMEGYILYLPSIKEAKYIHPMSQKGKIIYSLRKIQDKSAPKKKFHN